MNHDDDVLYFELYEDGEKADEYNSSPAYFSQDENADDRPVGGDASKLTSVFGAGNAARIEEILRASAEDYVFQTDRHRDLAAELGFPAFSVGVGYTYAEQGDLPPGLAPDTYTRSSE